MFKVGDKVRVLDNPPATSGIFLLNPFWYGKEGEVTEVSPFGVGYTVDIDGRHVRLLDEEMEYAPEPFDYKSAKMYILECQARLAEAMFYCELEEKEELKEQLRCAGYCTNDVMDLFNE